MKLVKENIEFKRGKNVTDALNVGPYAVVENPSKEYLNNLEDGLYIVSTLIKNEPRYLIVDINHNRELSADGRRDIVEMNVAWENTKHMAKFYWKLGENRGKFPDIGQLSNVWKISSIQRLKEI